MFPLIYQAYQARIIDVNAIIYYLGRMYHERFGERLVMERPYTIADEVKQLIEELNLKK